MATTKAETGVEIVIHQIEQEVVEFCILGTTPIILNRLSQKAQHELLMPKGRKTAADKAGSLKHDPIDEFRDSPYLIANENAPTLVGILPTAFKGAMRTAALDMPGAKKSQIGRLVYVDGEILPVYGTPKLFMSITRSADMNRTPDVRTRMILPEWACKLTVRYTKPILRQQSVVNLLSTAGFQCGVGDWRQEKGSGNYGSFRLVAKDDPDFVRITGKQGRAAQIAARDKAEPYDLETEELLSWFRVESNRRGMKVAA